MICEVVLIDSIHLILIGELFLFKFAYKEGLLILLNGFFSVILTTMIVLS